MRIVRSNTWEFIGECWGMLLFRMIKYPEEMMLVRQAKFVDVDANKVYHLAASDPDGDLSSIPYQRKHLNAYVTRKPRDEETQSTVLDSK